MQKLEFGTAGIRGILGKGEQYLNITHVYKIVDGYARYLLEHFPSVLSQGIVIGRDNRLESKNFAQAAACVLDSYGIPVHFSKDICPTPFVSYVIKQIKAVGGINITASHNPKEFNGLKLYNQYGSQILPDEANKIVSYFKNYNNFLNTTCQFNYQNNISNIKKKIWYNYLEEVIQLGGSFDVAKDIKIAFSPLHGTGAKPAKFICEKLGIQCFYEEKQMKNNRFFTYVKNPNPESTVAFEGVIKLGKKHNAEAVLVTDPDADRVGIGILNPNTQEYELLNGNETATLIFNYLLDINQNTNLDNHYLVYSFVSTSLPAIMAKQAKVQAIEIETGFKWVAPVVNEQKETNELLFAFEESYGSLINKNIAMDKDAIQSLVVLIKMISYYKKQNTNLIDVLNNIYKKYGYVVSQSISINLDPNNPNQLEELKEKFVNLKFQDFQIKKIIDYNKGYEHIEPNNMIKIFFKNNSWIALRPSGTEPKIKFYIFSINADKEQAWKYFNYFKKILINLSSR